jgi:hypothetical protein
MAHTEPHAHRTGALASRLTIRRALIWLHVALGLVAIFVCIYAFDMRGSGAGLILRAAPVLLPYAFSARHVWNLYTWEFGGPGYIRTAGFVGLLLVGAILVDATFLGAFGPIRDPFVYLGAVIFQGGAYVWGTEWILNVV